MIHVNDLFQGENGKFRRKVTSLQPWMKGSSFVNFYNKRINNAD